MSKISDTSFRIEERQFFAVRCCCQPTKVIGFLLLPKRGGPVRMVVDYAGHTHRAEIKTIQQAETHGLPCSEGGMSETVATTEQAIYSEDRGEEFWRTIPGFIRVVTPEFISAILGRLPEADKA